MPLSLQSYFLGPLQNRTIVIKDDATHRALLIDPAYGSSSIVESINAEGYQIEQILFTHAHFDHIAGAAEIVHASTREIEAHLHPHDLPLWNLGGGAREFGFTVDTGIRIITDLDQTPVIHFCGEAIEVRHTPGHTPGHVVFYLPNLKTALVGDLIFYLGVGRTDLPNGDGKALINSIRTQILTLPDETILYPGHGPETTVGFERENNPFL